MILLVSAVAVEFFSVIYFQTLLYQPIPSVFWLFQVVLVYTGYLHSILDRLLLRPIVQIQFHLCDRLCIMSLVHFSSNFDFFFQRIHSFFDYFSKFNEFVFTHYSMTSSIMDIITGLRLAPSERG